MDNNYAFLGDYLNRVAAESMKVDQQTSLEDDDNEFFNIMDEEDNQGEPGIQYGITDPNEEEQEAELGMEMEDQASDEDADFMDAIFDTPDYAMEMMNDEMGEFADDFDEGDEETGEESENEEMDMRGFNSQYEFAPTTEGGGGGKKSSVGERIASTESGGDYKATNKNSTATGKYQFLWGKKKGQGWGDSIMKVTGVKSQKEFLNDPAAQDKYFKWYEKNYLKPEVKGLQPYNKQGLSEEQLMRLIHFRGAAGAKKYLKGQLKDKPESYNMPISEYIGKRQMGGLTPLSMSPLFDPTNGSNVVEALNIPEKKLMKGLTGTEQMPSDWLKKRGYTNKWLGFAADQVLDPINYIPLIGQASKVKKATAGLSAGARAFNTGVRTLDAVSTGNDFGQTLTRQRGGYVPVARTEYEQYNGLNNPEFEEMLFPLYGDNEFRGLDNGEPVYLEDETGKKKVLRGRKDKTKMKGKVYEKRLKK